MREIAGFLVSMLLRGNANPGRFASIAAERQTVRKNFQRISPEAQAILVRHPWRGNVRNLRNLIERVVLSEDGPVLEQKQRSQIVASFATDLSLSSQQARDTIDPN